MIMTESLERKRIINNHQLLY